MSYQNSDKVVFISGASSGIGLETALMLLEKGYKVYGAARSTDKLAAITEHGGHALFLDLYDEATIEKCINQVLQEEGRIDILINNAGFGMGGSLENVTMKEARDQFQVNVFGLIALTQKVLPSMRENHFGKIINISSIAGRFSSPFLGWYHASKYSVEALSDALRSEVKSFGIDVILIEPGLTKTNWGVIAADSIQSHCKDTPYENNGNKVADFYSHYYKTSKNITEPTVISKTIVKAVCATKPKVRYPVGKFSKLFIAAAKICSDKMFDKLLKFTFKQN